MLTCGRGFIPRRLQLRAERLAAVHSPDEEHLHRNYELAFQSAALRPCGSGFEPHYIGLTQVLSPIGLTLGLLKT